MRVRCDVIRAPLHLVLKMPRISEWRSLYFLAWAVECSACLSSGLGQGRSSARSRVEVFIIYQTTPGIRNPKTLPPRSLSSRLFFALRIPPPVSDRHSCLAHAMYRNVFGDFVCAMFFPDRTRDVHAMVLCLESRQRHCDSSAFVRWRLCAAQFRHPDFLIP